MSKEVKAAIITGVCALLAGIIGTFAVTSITNNNSQAVSVYVNGNEVKVNPDEYQAMYDDLEKQYNQLKAKAEDEYNRGFEDGKSSVITSGNPFGATNPPNQFSESVSLFDLKPYVKGTFDIPVRHNCKDNMGNVYEKSFTGYMSVSDGGQSQTYDIGKKYSTLTGTVAIQEGCEASPDSGYIKIYGDNHKLLWSKTDFSASTKPFEISVDIGGVTDLTIEMVGNGNMGWDGLRVLFSDIVLA